MKNQYLTWQAKAPTHPGLYIRTDGFGKVQLMHASVQRFLDSSRIVHLTEVVPGFVANPVIRPVSESLHVMPADSGNTTSKFLGPVKLPKPPTDKKLAKSEYALPTEPGIYYLSRNLGHRWLPQLVAVNIHRYLLGGVTPVDELIAFDLPSLERRDLKDDDRGVILTLALPYPRLNLQTLPA